VFFIAFIAYACIYIHICIHMLCMYIYICVFISIYVNVYIYIYIRLCFGSAGGVIQVIRNISSDGAIYILHTCI